MSILYDWLIVPLSYPFMQRALVVSLLVAAVCAVLSCYLVLKGWSLMGDAISHAVLPGIVVAYVVGCRSRSAPSSPASPARCSPATSRRTAASRRTR